jgi:1-phosphatidylinositol-4-phosphate 5-kinase
MGFANISPMDIHRSLESSINRKNVFKAGQGAGASGSFFFFSSDNRFIIKTLLKNEKDILLGLLNPFIQHLVEHNGASMIAKIFGVFTIRTKMYAPLDFVIMENIARLTNPVHDKITFDLKGSTVGREIKLKNLEWNKKLKYSGVLKDINFIQISNLRGKLIDLDQERREEMINIL